MRVEQFPFEYFQGIEHIKRKRGNPGTKTKTVYKNIITAFDIETTALTEIEQSIMYIWQWHFDGIGTVLGRSWEEFIYFCRELKKALAGMKLVAYVHNLSHEFQFLKGIYRFESDDIFATDRRKILKATISDAIEFRCSYFLTNMSLAQFLKKMGVEHVKLDGEEFDYKIRRFPWTPLTEKELEYCIHDVLGLVEGIKKLMSIEGDNLSTIPLTQTGFVRRDTKRAMHSVRKGLASGVLPYYNLYKLAREAFRGGDTHASRYIVGVVLSDVRTFDRSSSYPAVLVNNEYPVRPFHMSTRLFTRKMLEDFIYLKEKPILCRCAFENVRLKNPFWGCPYIPVHKCRNLKGYINDNGRVLKADYLEISLTDIDYKIINSEYLFDDVKAWDVAYSGYQRLPQQWIDTIILYFDRKTALKNVEGEELYYMLGKQKLNSEYGMSAQQPVKQNVVFTDDNVLAFTEYSEEDLYYESQKKCFLSYAWGVWCTAYARQELHEMILNVCKQGAEFVYCDTDCVRYQGVVDWEGYNNRIISECIKHNGAAKDAKGKTHYLGAVEEEPIAKTFITWGAKKYAYTTADGKLHLTLAGVNKKKGAQELEKAGGLEAFKPGFIFRKGGGTESVYNDFTYGRYDVDGKSVYITDNLYIRDSEYTLGLTEDYITLLKNVKHGGKI